MSAVALICCFIPGFDSLGYFSALIMGGLGSALGLSQGALEASRLQGQARSTPRLLAAVAASSWILLLPPLVILSANALFVPNCDLLEGAAFYGMSAGLGVLFSTQLGAACALITGGAGRGAVVALMVGLLWTGRDVFHLYTDPPIFIFNPFFGFFSGAIYDDVIAIDPRFLWFRLGSALQVAWLWAFLQLGWHEGEWSLAAIRAQGVQSRARLWGVFALLSFLCGGMFGGRAAMGIEMDQTAIEAQLGGRLESGPITLIYDRGTTPPEEAERLMWDARFRLDQLKDRLQRDSVEPFTLFIYGSADQKRALMGARRVHLAKPWLRQAHIHRLAVGDRTLAHEMAHVLLAAYAPGPLHVPAERAVLVNAAILEGAAVALEPPAGRFNVHEKSAAMRHLGLAPDLHQLLGPDGFWAQSAARAYTLSGSFLRWLYGRHGAEAFTALYGTMDFQEAYGADVDELIEQWQTWVDDRPISPELLAWADVTYRRAGVLHRVCPLEIARLNDEANRLLQSGQRSAAIEALEAVVGHLPGDPSSVLRLASVLAITEAPAIIESLVAESLAIEDLPAILRARFHEVLADARWRHGDTRGAADVYGELALTPLSPEHARSVKLKRDVCLSPELEPVYGPYLLGGLRDPQVDLVYLTEATADLRGEAIATYLLGRRTLQAGDAPGAIGPLKTTLARLENSENRGSIGLDTSQAVELEAWRLLGHAQLNAGALLDAEAAFARAAQLSTSTEERATNLDWAGRASWLRTHPDRRE